MDRLFPTVSFTQAISWCKLAYTDEINHFDLDRVVRDNAKGFVYREAQLNQVTIGVAGTNDIDDLINAAQFCGTGNRHRGFYLHSLRMKKALEALIGPRDTVTICGHSLGGVVGQYLSLDMARHCKAIQVISFGAPKGFRKPFSLPKNVSWRIVTNDLDMIPDYPILVRYNWPKFFEMNLPIKFNDEHWKTMGLTLNNDPSRPLLFSQRVTKILLESRSFAPITNMYRTIHKYHSINNYERMIAREGI
jgi:hypothetical protein